MHPLYQKLMRIKTSPVLNIHKLKSRKMFGALIENYICIYYYIWHYI